MEKSTNTLGKLWIVKFLKMYKLAIILLPGFKALQGLYVDGFADVCPVTVYGPHNFSCQIMGRQKIDCLRQLMDSIQRHYDALQPGEGMLESPSAGMACCALYPGLLVINFFVVSLSVGLQC